MPPSLAGKMPAATTQAPSDMGSLHGFMIAHWDHEPWRQPSLAASEPGFPAGRQDACPRICRFMERENLQNSDANRGHEPARGHPGRFGCWTPRGGDLKPDRLGSLPSKAGGTPARRFMESFHDVLRMLWDHEPTPTPTAVELRSQRRVGRSVPLSRTCPETGAAAARRDGLALRSKPLNSTAVPPTPPRRGAPFVASFPSWEG